MRPKKNIIKIFLDTGKCWVTLCYTIFSLISESTILLPGPLLFSGFGLWFLGSWSWLLELPLLELLGSCPGFGLLCWGCWLGPGCACCAAAMILNPGSELLQTWYDRSTIIYTNIKINTMLVRIDTKNWLGNYSSTVKQFQGQQHLDNYLSKCYSNQVGNNVINSKIIGVEILERD